MSQPGVHKRDSGVLALFRDKVPKPARSNMVAVVGRTRISKLVGLLGEEPQTSQCENSPCPIYEFPVVAGTNYYEQEA